MKILLNNSHIRFFYSVVTVMIVFTFASYCFAKPKLGTQVEVLNYINTITDFNDLGGIIYSYKQVNITDDNTPFLHEQIKGKKDVWLVEAKNVYLRRFPSGRENTDRKFSILVDSNSGKLLKITSKYDGFDPDMKPEPNAASAERQIGGNEKYLGFPDTPPTITFLKALDILNEKAVSKPTSAKEIDAYYISWSSNDMSWISKTILGQHNVWVITLRGVPALPGGSWPGEDVSKIKKWSINHLRIVLDAETGEILSQGNSPQPEVKKESD
jgi:hypothetical protein